MTDEEEQKWFYISQIRDPLDLSGTSLLELMDHFNVDGLRDLSADQCRYYFEEVFSKKSKRRKQNEHKGIHSEICKIKGFGRFYRRTY